MYIDQGLPVDSIYLDFSTAFDRVPHARLEIKLKSHGIGGSVSDWITEWLTGLYIFYVCVCVCVFVCVCVCVCVYVYMYVYSVHTYACMYGHACIHADTDARVHTHTGFVWSLFALSSCVSRHLTVLNAVSMEAHQVVKIVYVLSFLSQVSLII